MAKTFMTLKQKIVSIVIVGGLFRLSEFIANIIMWLMRLFKTRKPYYLYVYLKYEQDFLYPLAEKICYYLGLKKEWDVHQEGLDKLHKLIFREDVKKD
jgi:uncharacterized protein YpbB